MAKQLVLVSHGRFCEELKASTEMIIYFVACFI